MVRAVSPLQRNFALASAVVFAVLMGLVTISAQRIEGQRQLDRVQTKRLAIENVNRELRAQIAEAESPVRAASAGASRSLVDPAAVLALEPAPVASTAPQEAAG